jgi:hypothetical protein
MRKSNLRPAKRTLISPQHLHILVWCYEDWNGTGVTGKSCDVTLIANDEEWAEAEGIRLSGLPKGHKTQIQQCTDEAHLKNLQLP